MCSRARRSRAGSWWCGFAAAVVGLAVGGAPLAGPAKGESLEHARSLVREDRLAQALDAYSEVLSRAQTDRDARLERSRVLGWLGRHEESLADLELLLERDPEDADARVARARLLGWMGRPAEGEDEARLVLAANPRDLEALLVLGDLQSWQDRQAEALEAFSEAHRLAPEDPRPLVRMGRVLAGQGRSPAARAAYQQALEIDPGAADAREALKRLEEAPRRHRFRIDAGAQFDDLDRGHSDWWYGNAFLSVPVAESVILRGGIEQYRRFDEDETQGTIGA